MECASGNSFLIVPQKSSLAEVEKMIKKSAMPTTIVCTPFTKTAIQKPSQGPFGFVGTRGLIISFRIFSWFNLISFAISAIASSKLSSEKLLRTCSACTLSAGINVLADF